MYFFQFAQRVRRRIREQPPFARLYTFAGYVAAVVVVMTAWYMRAGHMGLMDAVWQTWQTLTTVGYGDSPPKDTMTRLGVMVASLLGIAFLGATFTAALDAREYRRLRKRTGMEDHPHRDGYIVVQYPGIRRLQDLIREVRIREREVPFCIVDGGLEELPSDLTHLPGKIHFVRGRLLDAETYQRARVSEAKAIVVFAPPQPTPESDAVTASIVRTIEGLITDRTRLMHIIVDGSNEHLFQGLRSIPISRSFEVLAAVQEMRDAYSAVVAEDILSNDRGADLTTVRPTGLDGWTWGEFVSALALLAHRTKLSITPLAIIDDGDVVPCPEVDRVIRGTMLISVVAREPNLDWPSIERQLQACRPDR